MARLSSANSAHTTKPDLKSWRAVRDLDWNQIQEGFKAHVNPGFLQLLRRLGYDGVRCVAAEDMHLIDATGRRILDCWGGFGSLNVGHNHPRLAEVRRAFDEEKQVELCHAFLPAHATILAENLAELMPEDLGVSYLCCSGSEAVESALKLVVKYKQNKSGKILYAHNAMHGKTHGALSVTGSEHLQEPFKSIPGCRAIPFGDAATLREFFDSQSGRGPEQEIVAVILEPIQSGGGVIVPERGYLSEARRLCDEYGAVLIIDEVQTGLGRTGRIFAFEHEPIVPDVVVLSKSLGGGKTPIAAMVARRSIVERAYGSTQDCTLHSSTFSGMGCAAAIATETLHILFDDGLIENAAHMGEYLIGRLRDLARRFPGIIRDVRGRGLLIGVEFKNIAERLPELLSSRLGRIKAWGEGALVALVAGQLLTKYNILVAFTDFNRDVMRLVPPLTMQRKHADELVEALEEILSRGIMHLFADTMKTRLFEVIE